MDRAPTVYILASGRHGTLYTGVTSALVKRLHEHREGLIKGFTSRYGITHLVHFESFDEMIPAIAREKQIKKWSRQWKIGLIETRNPNWDDLAVTILGFAPLGRPRRHPRENGDPRTRSFAIPDDTPSMDPRFRGDDERF